MKEKVAFVCVHNSCRSQIAEALGKSLASEIFESYSAGTETKPQINQDAVRLMKEQYRLIWKKHNIQNCCLKYHRWTLSSLWDVMLTLQ